MPEDNEAEKVEEGKARFLGYVAEMDLIVPGHVWKDVKDYEPGTSSEKDKALANFESDCEFAEIPKVEDLNPYSSLHTNIDALSLRTYSEPIMEAFSTA